MTRPLAVNISEDSAIPARRGIRLATAPQRKLLRPREMA